MGNTSIKNNDPFLHEFELHKMTTRCNMLDCQTRLFILQPNNFAKNSHDSFIYNFVSALCQKAGINNIKQVDVYESKSVIEQYRSKKTEFRDIGISCEEVWVFHGTPLDEIRTKIMCEGFKAGRCGAIYTAKTTALPINYCRGSNKLVLARGLLGKSCNSSINPSHDDVYHSGLHSWIISDDVIVFPLGQQLSPMFIVHF